MVKAVTQRHCASAPAQMHFARRACMIVPAMRFRPVRRDCAGKVA
jgi:hypothetical protein